MKGTTKKTLLMLALTLTLGAGASVTMAATNGNHHDTLQKASDEKRVDFKESEDGKKGTWTVTWKCDVKDHNHDFTDPKDDGTWTSTYEGTKKTVDATCQKGAFYYWEATIEGQSVKSPETLTSEPVAHNYVEQPAQIYYYEDAEGTKEVANPTAEQLCTLYYRTEVRKVCQFKDHKDDKEKSVIVKAFDIQKPRGHVAAEGTIKYTFHDQIGNGLTLVDGKPARKDDYSGGKYDVTAKCERCKVTYTVSKDNLIRPLKVKVNEVGSYYEGKKNVEDDNIAYTSDGELDKENTILTDCNKPGVVTKVTVGVPGKDGNITITEDIPIDAHHVWKHKEFKNLSKTLHVSADGTYVVNDSCAVKGTYTEVFVCKGCGKTKNVDKEVERSNAHSYVNPQDLGLTIFEAINKGYVTTTGDCVTMGTETWVEKVCTVCGDKKGTVTKAGGKYGHEHSKDGKDGAFNLQTDFTSKKTNGKDATDHHPGYYTSHTVCNFWNVEHDTTIVSTDAKNPLTFDWKYEIVWTYNQGKAGYNNSEAYYEKWVLDEKPDAYVVAVPQDSDLTEAEKEALTCTMEVNSVKEDKDKRVDTSENALGERTYIATAKAGRLEPNKYLWYSNYDEFVENSDDADFLAEERILRYTENTYTDKAMKSVAASPALKDTQAYKFNDGTYKGEKKEEETTATPKKSIKGAVIEGRITYRGEYSPIPYTVTLDGKKLKENVDFVFTNTQKNTFKVVGSHKVTIQGIGEYKGSAKGKLYIDPAKQKIKVSLSKKTFKASALKKKAASFDITVKNAKGKVTYSLKKNNKKIEISKKGKVTLKKGLKAGKYQITVKAAATKNYKAASKTVTFTVK